MFPTREVRKLKFDQRYALFTTQRDVAVKPETATWKNAAPELPA
jgi:hypothetical protein